MTDNDADSVAAARAAVAVRVRGGACQEDRRVALRLYESLGRHGLRREAGRAFRDAVAAADDEDAQADGEGGGAVAGRELTGMACLLKDGFVGYLRELAKITPPVPKQVRYCKFTITFGYPGIQIQQ